MKKKIKKVSLGQVARLSEVSITAAGFAMKNKPGISLATRERIRRIAKELGYVPDARLSSMMAQLRNTVSQDLLPIAWLNTSMEKDAWQRDRFRSPVLEGARLRAQELGYRLEEVWCHEPGMTIRRLSKILYQRRIEGVIVTHPARHLRLDWDHLASVALGASLLAPRLHWINADLNFNLRLALKSLGRLGYQRVGICLAQQVDIASHYVLGATARDVYFNASPKKRIPPLIYAHHGMDDQAKARETIAWLKRHEPDVVVGHDNRLKNWVEEAGFRVPEDMGIVHLAVDDDVLNWAGIHSRRRVGGATAVDWLVSLMRNHQYGLPETPLNILIRGVWQNGKTLKMPSKAKIDSVRG